MIEKQDALGYYAVLEVHPEADDGLIKRQYYEKAKFWHPDHNDNPQALEKFQKVSVAYDVLKDKLSRLQYDILSCVYDAAEFPPLGSLKIYKNQSSKDDKALRVLRQRTVKNGVVRESKDICNIREAGNMVLSTSITNWLCGWWGKKGFSHTVEALKFNRREVSACNADNMKLLVHNAVAYMQENNSEMAWVYAKQAELMCGSHEYLSRKLAELVAKTGYQPKKAVTIPRWNAAELVRRQYLFPLFLGLLAVLGSLLIFANQGLFLPRSSNKGYYEAGSDMVETKIIKTDSDAYSKRFLVHLTEDCTIYHGPDERYSPMTTGNALQTVRIIGHTSDKKWYQIILDNGEMGYIQKSKTAAGVGNPIPAKSHVYKGSL